MKTSIVLTLIPTNVLTVQQVVEDFYNSKPRSEMRKKLLQQVSTNLDQLMPITYHEWVNTCTSHIDDEEFMKFFLEKMSASVEATFEQWWMTYDLAEYCQILRDFALAKMIQIRDSDSWELVRKEYDRRDDDDHELHLTALKILSELGHRNNDIDPYSGDTGLDSSEIEDYLLVKETSGRGNS